MEKKGHQGTCQHTLTRCHAQLWLAQGSPREQRTANHCILLNHYCYIPLLLLLLLLTQPFSFAEFRSSAWGRSMRRWSVQFIGIAGIAGIALATNTTNTTNTTTTSEGNCTALDFPACQDCNSCEEAFECAGVACLQDGVPSMLECEYSEERQWYLVCTSQISQAHAKLLLIAPLIFCLRWISWGARAP